MNAKKKSEYNEQKNKYTQKYIRENYKQLSIRLPKDGPVTRESIQEAAKRNKTSVNAYILRAVLQQMTSDAAGAPDPDGIQAGQEEKQ